MTKRTRRILIAVGALLGVLVVLVVAALLSWPRINDVTTRGTREYRDIRPQQFQIPFPAVNSAAVAVLKEMDIEITRQSPREIQGVATTPVFRFEDDVTVSLSTIRGVTIVDVRSRSRVGRGDFGTNARRIRDFQRRLEARLEGPASGKK